MPIYRLLVDTTKRNSTRIHIFAAKYFSVLSQSLCSLIHINGIYTAHVKGTGKDRENWIVGFIIIFVIVTKKKKIDVYFFFQFPIFVFNFLISSFRAGWHNMTDAYYPVNLLRNSFYLFLLVIYIAVVHSHVCMLQKRFNPSSRTLQWSLPRNELCLCQGVVAPRTSTIQSCLKEDDAEAVDNLWFTDDPTPLIDRRNWKPAELDKLLNRSFCCTCFVLFLCISAVVENWN